jgi:ferric-dicitrate binding protein FerR (iron transport regulator)
MEHNMKENSRTEIFQELLFKYFVGELNSADEKQLLDWLKESEENKRLFSEMTDWWAAAHIPLFKSDLEADFKEHFSHLLCQSNTSCSKRRFISPQWTKIAAAVLLILLLSVSSFWLGREWQGQGNSEDTFIYALYGTQSKVVLPDQSTVILNAGSSLRYGPDFNKKERNVKLDGEAYFEVAPDSKKVFNVTSGEVRVCVQGTSFNVKAYANESTVDIALITGKVRVSFEQGEEADLFLSPNQQLSYNKLNNRSTISMVKATNSILWTKGILLFSEKSFSDIAKALERKYAVSIHIKSDALLKEVFTGSFSSHYSLDEIIREIDVDSKYKWYYENGELIITDK